MTWTHPRERKRKVVQEDSWEEVRGDVEQLTQCARAHHALLVNLIERFEALEAAAGAEDGDRRGNRACCFRLAPARRLALAHVRREQAELARSLDGVRALRRRG